MKFTHYRANTSNTQRAVELKSKCGRFEARTQKTKETQIRKNTSDKSEKSVKSDNWMTSLSFHYKPNKQSNQEKIHIRQIWIMLLLNSTYSWMPLKP